MSERIERTLDEDRRWHGSITDACFTEHAKWKAPLAALGYSLSSHFDHREGRWCLHYETSGEQWDSDLELHGVHGAEWVFRYYVDSDPLVAKLLIGLKATLDDPHCGAWYERRERMALADVLARIPEMKTACLAAVERFRMRLRD